MHQFLFENKFSFFIIIFLSLTGCEKNNNTIVDSVGNAPVLIGASFSPSIINTDTINVAGKAVRSPDDTITIKELRQEGSILRSKGRVFHNVRYSVTNYNFSSSLTEGALHDDGVFPDAKANDGIFSGYH